MIKRLIFFYFVVLFLYGCDTLKKSLGVTKDPPDEFLIKKIDPVEKPPNYELLPPDSKVKNTERESKNKLQDIVDKDLSKNLNKKNVSNIDNTEQSDLESEILKNINKK